MSELLSPANLEVLSYLVWNAIFIVVVIWCVLVVAGGFQ